MLDAQRLLSPAARIEPNHQAGPQELAHHGAVVRPQADIEELTVVEEAEGDLSTFDDEEMTCPVVGLAIDDDLALGDTAVDLERPI